MKEALLITWKTVQMLPDGVRWGKRNVSSSFFTLSLVTPSYFAQKSTSLVNKVGLLWVSPLRLFAAQLCSIRLQFS